MTQKEFEERTKISLTVDDFDTIHDIYMACGDKMDKDKFCALFKGKKFWELLNCVTYEKKITEQTDDIVAKKIKNMQDRQKTKNMELAEFLLGKACAYEDTDFYREAVKLIGQGEVTRMKLQMELPLWDEDKKYIKSVLIENI